MPSDEPYLRHRQRVRRARVGLTRMTKGAHTMVTSMLRFPGDMFADFDELQRQLDRMLGWRTPSSSIRAVQRGSFPALNVGTTADAVEVYAFAPGIDTSTLNLTIDKGLLTIAGERKSRSTGVGRQGHGLRTRALRRRIPARGQPARRCRSGSGERVVPRRHPACAGAKTRSLQATPHRGQGFALIGSPTDRRLASKGVFP